MNRKNSWIDKPIEQSLSKEQRCKIEPSYHSPKIDEKGKKINVNKKYFDTNVYIQVTDPEILRDLYPAHYQHIVDDIDSYYVFFRKTDPILNSNEKMKQKADEFRLKYGEMLSDYGYNHGISKEEVELMNIFQLEALEDKMKKYKESKKSK